MQMLVIPCRSLRTSNAAVKAEEAFKAATKVKTPNIELSHCVACISAVPVGARKLVATEEQLREESCRYG